MTVLLHADTNLFNNTDVDRHILWNRFVLISDFSVFFCSSGSVCGPSFSSALSSCYWCGFTSGGRPTMTTASLTGE